MAKRDTKHLMQRGNVWYIVARRPDGSRLVQSTGTGDLSEAQAIRDSRLEPLKLSTERARMSAVQDAIGTVDDRLEQIADAVPATSVRHAWQAYLDQQNRPDSGPSTLSQYEGWYEAFAKWMKARHPDTLELRHVTQAHADQYAGYLQKQVAATTFNRTINCLSLVWRVLEKTARLSGNPWKGISRKRFAVHSRRELTLEELGRVCAAATGETRTLIALGVYCGLRLGDAALLRWADVDTLKGIISLVPQKTARLSQKRVTLPIHPVLLEMLNDTTKRTGYVMPSIAERYQQYNAALSGDILKLFESVGIETSSKVDGSDRSRPDCGFHSLRHTFVSLCAAGGVPQSVVQAMVGHGSPSMTQHYTHVATDAARRAVAMLPDVTAPTHAPDATRPETGTADGLAAILEGLRTLDAASLQIAADEIKRLSK
jgi:integrase